MYKTLVPFLFAASAIYAAEQDPMVAVCERLVEALEQEVEALESIKEPSDAAACVDKLRSSLQALEDLFAEDEKLLWQYIDNTSGAKQPIIDVLEQLALQFARVEQARYFGNEELRRLLAPQIDGPGSGASEKRSKREKLHEIDHDAD